MDLLDCTVPVRITRSTGAVHYGNCGSVQGAPTNRGTMTLREVRDHPRGCRQMTCRGHESLLHRWEVAVNATTLHEDAVVLLHPHTPLPVRRWRLAEQLAGWVADTGQREPVADVPVGAVLRMSPHAATWLWKDHRPSLPLRGYSHLDEYDAATLPYLVGGAGELPGPASVVWPTLITLTGEAYAADPDAAARAALALQPA